MRAGACESDILLTDARRGAVRHGSARMGKSSCRKKIRKSEDLLRLAEQIVISST